MTDKQSRGSAFQWALAAALLVMLAAAGYLLREYLAQRGRIAQLEQERDLLERSEQELQQQLSNQKSAEAQSSKELSTVREKLLRAQKQLAAQGQTDTHEIDQRDVKIIGLNLSAQTRAGKIELLSLPANADFVSVTLQLENTGYSEYQIALKDLDADKTIWQSGKLMPVGKTIQFGMPAKLLKEENYIFELSGISDDVPEVISGYPFRTVMQ
jgi:hypothetical protein